MVFWREGKYTLHGRGQEIAEFSHGPFLNIYRTFTWKADKEKYSDGWAYLNVTITYNNGDSTLYLREVKLNDKYLSGEIHTTKEKLEVSLVANTKQNWSNWPMSEPVIKDTVIGDWEKTYEKYLEGLTEDDLRGENK